MSNPVVEITNFTLKFQQKPVLDELCWTINEGENWLLWGKSGSGKTSLARAIAQLIPGYGSISLQLERTAVHYVANWYQFKDLEGQSNFYYQQRYNKQSVETTNTVSAELKHFGQKHQLDHDRLPQIVEGLGFTALLPATLIQLSSGEHKKMQLVKAIWLKPRLLILDLPYNGLDAASRLNLNRLLDEIAGNRTQLLLIANDTELPTAIHRFAKIEAGKLLETNGMPSAELADEPLISNSIPAFLLESNRKVSGQHLISMKDISVTYGDKKVLKNINWEVKPGEKWALQGPNGSGKSTLLSLICADHPQAFANDFYLFGNKRGSGESIWEIKERIGLISPELHWYFDPSATVWQSIVSGFYDSSGLFCEPGYTKRTQADELIRYFDLQDYSNTLVSQLPLGKQRLAMLGRTIIKNPELLILDEPCQGLDLQQTRQFNGLIDELCKNGTTLIYVGHYESLLPSCIEKRIVLQNGEIQMIANILETVHPD